MLIVLNSVPLGKAWPRWAQGEELCSLFLGTGYAESLILLQRHLSSSLSISPSLVYVLEDSCSGLSSNTTSFKLQLFQQWPPAFLSVAP